MEKKRKAAIVGEPGVGKTSLLLYFIDGAFPDEKATVAVDSRVKTISVDGKNVTVEFFDTAGQEKFTVVTQSFFRYSNAVVIVFDITSQDSFDNVPQWLKESRTYASSAPIVLVGNKTDLNSMRIVTEEVARAYAEKENIAYFETSAKEGINVSQTFEHVAKLTMSENQSKPASSSTVLTRAPEKKKKGCTIL